MTQIVVEGWCAFNKGLVRIPINEISFEDNKKDLIRHWVKHNQQMARCEITMELMTLEEIEKSDKK